ncbi:MAG: PEP-CTERM sorting domain-containing protein [Burkholderiaceae bacterium]|jgi:hypothetical protein
MKTTPLSALLTAALGAVAFCAPAHAGTIVNIQAYTSGASIGAGIDYPFAAVGTTVHFDHPNTLQLAAGDYTITDAWGQAGALYDAWNFQLGADGSWTDHFSVGAWQGNADSPSAYTLLIDGLPGSGAGHYGGYFVEGDANASFLAHAPYTLHLDQDTLVGFAAPDYALWDNAGGISLEIDRVGGPSAVPEPTNVMLMLAGLGVMAGIARRRARKGA